MKLTKLNTLALLASGACLTQLSLSAAETNKPAATNAPVVAISNSAPPAARPAMRPPSADQRAARLKADLGLNETQEAKVKAAFETVFKQQAEYRQLPIDQARPKMQQLQADFDKQMKEALTEQQYEKWKALSGRRNRQPGAGGPAGGPPHTPPPAEASAGATK
jgi:hypothetical protein